MKEKPNVEELITFLLIKDLKPPKGKRLATAQEFREWLNGSCRAEDI